jgi:hypothetical protein
MDDGLHRPLGSFQPEDDSPSKRERGAKLRGNPVEHLLDIGWNRRGSPRQLVEDPKLTRVPAIHALRTSVVALVVRWGWSLVDIRPTP